MTIENDNVKVRARKSELVSNKRIKAMAHKLSSESKKIVVIGGGPAGATCVEALRQEGKYFDNFQLFEDFELKYYVKLYTSIN